MIGRTLGDFVIQERLGAGGAGEVYLAEQLSLGRQAVIKVMAQTGAANATASERFLREARLASSLDHPFVAHVYGFGCEQDGMLWIAMELVRGQPLSRYLQDHGPIPLARFVPLLERICEVVHAAHEQGIIHRDIKPHNVMVLSRAGRMLPKLLDLGIARRTADNDDGNAQKGDLKGAATPDGALPDGATTTNAPTIILDNHTPAPAMNPALGTTPRSASDSGPVSGLVSGQTLDLKSTKLSSRIAESETLHLTNEGAVIGTPHYMAPEQWARAAKADAKADQYSLAILAYEALAGRVPYAHCKSVIALARAHGLEALPPFPATLEIPQEIHAVLQKAAAKKAADRYSSTVEFAAAFRAASGIGIEPLVLPQLDGALLDRLLSDAPQPVAEAIALIEAARTPRQQLEAYETTRKVLARYIAILALASRGRVGAGGPKDSDALSALLVKLVTGRLSDEEWWQLAAESCKPFALRPQAHPLPELVGFFWDGAEPRRYAPFEQPVVAPEGDDHVHTLLVQRIPELGRCLEKMLFICDYALIVRREEAERWMGTRRIRRLTQRLDKGVEEQAFLIDAVGLPVLSLAPLISVMAPSGGMPEELFLLEGAGRNGARMVALPGPFERQSEEVWRWLSEHVLDVAQTQEQARSAEKPPYKGLSTFTADDADNYFGREAEAESFANRLRTQGLLAVVGPSGTGKSSFVLAGVLPLLPPGWRALVARPGGDPWHALSAKLQQAGLAPLAPEDSGDELVASLGADGMLLIVIDQFEELVTLCQDPAVRSSFAAMLVSLAAHKSDRLRVVLTLRDDFLIKVQQLHPLRERLSSSLQLMATPALEDLMRVVTEPARRVGYGFDDSELPRKMVEAVAEYPGALALLSFTASQLWELRDRQLKQMRAKTYEALGGVGGALAHHAEVTLAGMSEAESKLVREVFRHLVTSQNTRAVLSRQEMLDVLGQSPAAKSVLEKLIVARLLVTSESTDGDDRVEIIHEALLVSWPRLIAWNREDAETARLRDSLRASARQWVERGKPRGLLWRAETLTEYKVWRARYPGRLTAAEEAFATASVRDETRARRIRQALGATAFLALVVALVLISRAYQEATARFLALREEQARLALLDEKPLEALAYLHDALSRGAQNASLDRMAALTDYELQGSRGVVTRHGLPVFRLVPSPDAKWIASFSETNAVHLTAGDVGADHALPTDAATCISGAFTPDSQALVAGCDDGALRVYDVATRTRRTTFTVGSDPLDNVTVTPDGVYALVDIVYVGVHKVHLTTGAVTPLLLDATIPLLQPKFGPDKRTLALFQGVSLTDPQGALQGVILTDSNGKAQTRIGLDASVASVDFSPDGERLAIGARDGTLGVWHLPSKRWLWKNNVHSLAINAVRFAPDGAQLVSVGRDALHAWSASGTRRFSHATRRPSVTACWSPDGAHVFVAGEDQTVATLEAERGNLLWLHHGHTATVAHCATHPSGVLFTAGADGEVRAWDPSAATHALVAGVKDPRAIAGAAGSEHFVTLGREGLFVVGPDGAARLVHAKPLGAEAVVSLATNGAQAALAVDDELRVVDLASGETKSSRRLPSAMFSLIANAEMTRFAGIAVDGKPRLVSAREDGADVAIDDPSLSWGGFLTSTVATSCNGKGQLAAWDATSGKQLSVAEANKTRCFNDIHAGRIRAYGYEEGGISIWRLEANQLHRERALASSFGGELLGRAATPTLLAAAGSWSVLSDAGLTLGALPLRPDGFALSASNRDWFAFIDQQGKLARMHEPMAMLGDTEALKARIEQLMIERGVFDVTEGRLVKR